MDLIGRELDALIAEKITGWTGVYFYAPLGGSEKLQCAGWPPEDYCQKYNIRYKHLDHNIPRYSEDIEEAFMLADKIALFQAERLMLYKSDGNWAIGELFWEQINNIAEAETIPLVICKAALKMMEVQNGSDAIL
jgi:hypothetical protein